ncbi:MAG: S-adenosylmethionine:tRNA ribosyltransferase-isomerase [delta proteobacterium ML8_F1]|nr:MAG: S-adenosylmethionine:tRNA ribosyltransferase-isomerase [delta proteobacterium ML8_F1]
MKTSDFNYELPPELIAQHPLKERSESRLMVVHKSKGTLEHRGFKDVIEYFNAGDVLVVNDTRVMPGRIFGTKETGARVEFLILNRDEDSGNYECMVKPGKKARPGDLFSFVDGRLSAEIIEIAPGGLRKVRFDTQEDFMGLLEEIGEMPLPPYIKETLEEKNRYQTVYANAVGSAAAPTAGLHFTAELFKALEEKGVTIAVVTLHVGLGTFRPVKVEDITDHEMHEEFYTIDADNARLINEARQRGGRVFAVGTTSTRTLESIVTRYGELKACSGWTDIFIYPGYSFKIVEGLITNFHLPESTLIMLVSAFADRELIMKAYSEAVKARYRFFSFGDAMLIL